MYGNSEFVNIIRLLKDMSVSEARAKLTHMAQRRGLAGRQKCDIAHVRQTVASAQYNEQIRQANNRKIAIWQNRTRGK